MKTTTTNFRAIVRGAPSFAAAIDRLQEEGLSKGRAILIARKHDGKGYNNWQAWRQKTDDGRNLQFM